MKRMSFLLVAIVLVAFGIYACSKLSDNQSQPTAPVEITQIAPRQVAEQPDTTQLPVVASYTLYPSGWKFPFCGSWQISVGYGGPVCSGGNDGYHSGNDFYAIDWNLPGSQDNGQPIPAPASGYVRASNWDNCAGNYVIVDAGGGMFYKILHMRSRGVTVGQWVNVGSYLGECGGTGSCCQGSHVHFSIYYPAVWSGGRIVQNGNNIWGHGMSVPQNGISGQYNLGLCNYYPSGQSCQCH